MFRAQMPGYFSRVKFVLIAAALTIASFTMNESAIAQGSNRNSADAAFDKQFGDAFFDAYWAQYPNFALGVGYYKYADKLIVPDAKARDDALKFLDRWLARLRAIDKQALNPSHRADWLLLETELESGRFGLRESRAFEWNPSTYNVAEPFARIADTEYAPLDTRLRSIVTRLASVPAYYDAAKQSIKNPTHEHTQLAIEQNLGAKGVFGDELRKKVQASGLSEHEKKTFETRLDAALAAIDGYVAWLRELDKSLAQGNARSFRLGRELYEKKFAFDIQTGDTPEGLYKKAVREKENLHARMTMLTDALWPKYFPNAAPPADAVERIGKLIAKLSEQHVSRERFFPEIERQIPELAKWVTDHNLMTLDADKPLKVRVTPAHQRGVALASVDAPGPYDPTVATYYNVLPLDDMSAERAESLLREYNRWMLPILNIHEAIPGHYAQLVYGNKSPSKIKAIFGNGAMVEGWAVYGERMMLESGYGDHTAEIWLIYSKWLLRSVVNTILDYSVHVLGMSEAEAKQLLIREAFQSTEEANGKWRRVQLSSVQLTSYFAGYSAIYELREERKRALGERFELKRFHEQFLSYGNAPVSVIRDLMR